MKGLTQLSLLGIILLMSLSFMSACDWRAYGNTYTPLWNEQLSPSSCFGVFSVAPTNISVSQGMTVGTQPLVVIFGSTNSFLFFNNGNYLQVYDKNLILQQETLTGIALANLNSLDWNNDGVNELANLYTYNSTIYTLKVYSYTPTTNSLSLIYAYNITTTSIPTIAGLRNSGGNVYFINSSTLIKINNTNFIETPLSFSYGYTEPVSFYTDYNGDGIIDFMTWGVSNVTIFDKNGNTILTQSYVSVTGGQQLRSARMINPTGTSLWKLVTLTENGISTASPSMTLTLYNLDGSTYWSKVVLGGSSSSQRFYGDVAISDDYDGDYLPDIYVTAYRSHPLNSDVKMFRIYDGNTGDLLFASDTIQSPSTSALTLHRLTLADMNNDGKNDFIYNMQGNLSVFNPQTNQSLFTYLNAPTNYCIPADLNFDGTQDIICSGSGSTKVFFSNYTNQNAVINSVTYSPSTSIARYTTLTALVSATDSESNYPFYYKSKCSDSSNWSAEDTNSARTCYYDTIGSFNMSVAVRDFYHSTFVAFSQTIIVTETGTICGNAVCETGENNVNCPADCSSNVTTTQATETGGMPLPTKIVDLENTESGLLPEIYYGLLGFLSNTLTPMIILVFAIFFVMIMLALAFIVKKVFRRVGDLAH